MGGIEQSVKDYKRRVRTMLIPIKDKIAEDPSFDEMLDWLQSKESEFQEAFGGTNVYDGIAFTYKGGYAHSWNYGDYSTYDATTRPWYQAAENTNGEVIIVPAYMTYLEDSQQAVAQDVILSLTEKYNEDITFEIDLKMSELIEQVSKASHRYEGEKTVIFDDHGNIINGTVEKELLHNIFQSDSVISSSYSSPPGVYS